MIYVLAVILSWFLAVLNVSAMPYVKVLGVTPDFVLILAASWAMVRGQDEALIIVPIAGLLRDLSTSDPIGTSILAFVPIVLLAMAVRVRAVDTEFIPTVVVVATASLVYGVISMAVLSLSGQDIPLGHALLRVVVPSIFVNALFTPIIYLPVRWLSPERKWMTGSSRLTSPL